MKSEKDTMMEMGIAFNHPLKPIVDLIEKSKYILDECKEAGWDGDGDAYPIAKETWDRATDFVFNHSARLYAYNQKIPVPDINPCRNGSIDITYGWEDENITCLLINIKPSKPLAGFYGRSKDNPDIDIKGSLRPEKINKWLCEWMIEYL